MTTTKLQKRPTIDVDNAVEPPPIVEETNLEKVGKESADRNSWLRNLFASSKRRISKHADANRLKKNWREKKKNKKRIAAASRKRNRQ